MYYSVSEAGFLLGVHSETIRRWDKGGKIKCIRTVGNHRRIHRDEIKRIIEGKKRKYVKKKRYVATYSRVSSHDQKKKGDLERQKEYLKDYCKEESLEIKYQISEVASGLNAKRKGIHRLFKLVQKGKISEVVITYKDRLTRFGFEYLESFFECFGVKIINLNAQEDKTIQEEMVEDLIAIVASFSGRIHGMRSRKKTTKPKKIMKKKMI
ncbi:MAG: IS607 family transposase [Candidatus Kariarchaeaceae archaeon]